MTKENMTISRRWRGWLAMLAVGLLMMTGGPGQGWRVRSAEAARAMPASFADLVEKLSPAVVNVSTTQKVKVRPGIRGLPPGSPFEEFFDQFFKNRRPDGRRNRNRGGGDEGTVTRRLRSLGSGFIIDPQGYVVTNNHVVQGADKITVRTQDGDEYEAKIVGRDREVDIALLKIEADKPLPHVEWGDSGKVRVGDWVLAIGNPFGLGGTVTAGIISARHRDISDSPYADFLQTDASINRGNSGGPMFDLEGRVVGINTAIFSPTGGNIGIGFAIPANQARKVVAQLREFGYAKRGYLGVTIQPIDKVTAEALGLEKPEGAIVAQVSPGSPAAEGGIRSGDVIIAFNGKPISDSNDLVRAVSDAGVGKKVTVDLLRNGKRLTVSVTTAERPKSLTVGEDEGGKPGESGEDSLTATLGMDLSNLDNALREQFDIPPSVDGVLITDVSRFAAMRGFRPGDVILEVTGRRVGSVADVRKAVEALKKEGRKAALLRILRDDQYLFLSIPLEHDEDED